MNTDDVTREDLLLRAAQEYQAALEAGQRPNPQAFLAAHADLAGELMPYLEALDALHQGVGSALSSVRPVEPVGERQRPGVPSSDDPITRPLGDFHLLREIGRGGMGVVYEAVQLSLGRLVALKVLPFAAALDNRQLQRFKNEAQAAAQLHHNHIVPVYAVGCERGVHFYAMQLIQGRTLAELVAELRGEAQLQAEATRVDPEEAHPPATASAAEEPSSLRPQPTTGSFRSPSQPSARTTVEGARAAATLGPSLGRGGEFYRNVARLMLQAATALEHAHQQGVIHRDIKPANLLLEPRGHLWITDFGLALFATGGDLTRTGDLLGTLRYMSPEQASGQRVVLDGRTDIYSLGASFYELLALEPVFDGVNRPELLQQIANVEARPLHQRRRGVPVELETIIQKCLAKVPADRYATARELADDLERYLDNRPIHARPPGWLERGRKWLRRHPGFMAATGALLLLTVIGLLVSHTLVSQEQARTASALEREQMRAEQAERRLQQTKQLVELLIEVGAEELDDRPSMQGLRRRLLESALDHYQKLIIESGNDPKTAAGLTEARERVHQVLADVATLQGAERLYLLNNSEVMDELKLNTDQRQHVEDLVGRLHQHRVAAAAFQTGQTPTQRRQQHLERVRAAEAAVSEFLTPAQQKRLRQIAIRVKGLMAFRDPDVVNALGLTTTQRQSIRAIEQEVFSPPEPGRGKFRRLDDSFRKGLERCLALLTPQQHQKWADLTGPAFNHRGWMIPPGLFQPPPPPPPSRPPEE